MVQRRPGTRSWAVLMQGGRCTPLLLSDKVYAGARRWNGKAARVTGTALDRGPEAAPEIIELQYRDRWLSPLVCADSRQVLYVDSLKRLR